MRARGLAGLVFAGFLSLGAAAALAAAPQPEQSQAPSVAPTPARPTLERGEQMECAAEGTARLGQSLAELRTRAQRAARSNDALCVRRGLALADYLDREGAHACPAFERVALWSEESGDADLLAFEAWLAWRCGRPQRAHQAALAALALDESATAAWSLLGKLLTARFREAAASRAFDEALALDPEDPNSLLGKSTVAGSREERRALLRRFVSVAGAHGIRRERVRAALESLEYMSAIGERSIFRLEKVELPGALEMQAIIPGPGRVSGYIVDIEAGPLERVPALLDSGASGLHLDERSTERAEIEPLSEGVLVGGGGSGEHRVGRGLLDRLGLGPLVFSDALSVGAAGSLHPRGYYRAILGFDLFGGTRLVFDPDEEALRVLETLDPEAGEGARDPREVDPWPWEPGVVPIIRIAGMMLVPVEARSREGEARGLALFDTGAERSLFDEAGARRVGNLRLGGTRRARGYGGSIDLLGAVRAMEVQVGTLCASLRDVPIFSLERRSRLVGVHVIAFVGLDLIERHAFAMDLGAGTLAFEEAKACR